MAETSCVKLPSLDLTRDKSTLVAVIVCSVKQETITWVEVYPYTYCHMASLGHSDSIKTYFTYCVMEGTTRNVQQGISVVTSWTGEAINDPLVSLFGSLAVHIWSSQGTFSPKQLLTPCHKQGCHSETQGWKPGFDEASQRMEPTAGSCSVPKSLVPCMSTCGHRATHQLQLQQMSFWSKRQK